MYGKKERGLAVRPHLALSTGIAVGIMGGLIGLGGAEFRLPLLIGLFGLVVHQAVRLNLLVSLATVTAAVAARFGFAGAPDLLTFVPDIASLMVGAVLAAWIGAGLLARLSAAVLTRVIAMLLAIVSAVLLAEAISGLDSGSGLPADGRLRIAVGFCAGLGIGLISSLLGVAGGEFIIPTMMLAFGADVVTAGTASLLVSVPMVAVGVLRYRRQGAYRSRTELAQTALPMGIGSILGALCGAFLLPYAPAEALKALLGIILVLSAVRLVRKG